MSVASIGGAPVSRNQSGTGANRCLNGRQPAHRAVARAMRTRVAPWAEISTECPERPREAVVANLDRAVPIGTIARRYRDRMLADQAASRPAITYGVASTACSLDKGPNRRIRSCKVSPGKQLHRDDQGRRPRSPRG